MKVGSRDLNKVKSLLTEDKLAEVIKEIENLDIQKFAEEVEEELNTFNMQDITKVEVKINTITNVLLVVKLTNNYEATFCQTLCTPLKESDIALELCVKMPEGLKSLGFIDFTFENIQKIHAYNIKIPIYTLIEKKMLRLKPEQEICLL